MTAVADTGIMERSHFTCQLAQCGVMLTYDRDQV
jgi:hypothetical protein